MFIRKNVLLLSADAASRATITGMLTVHDFQVHQTASQSEAVNLVQSMKIPLVIAEIANCYEEGGLIELLCSSEFMPLVVVVSEEKEASSIISAMRQGAYDYLIKPVSRIDLIRSITEAFETAEDRLLRQVAAVESQLRKQNQITLDNIRKTGVGVISRQSAAMIASMRTSISQGPGFGAMNSVIKMIRKKAKPGEKGTVIPDSLLEMLYDNSVMAERVINALEKIDQVLNDGLTTKPLLLADFFPFVQSVVRELLGENSLWASRVKISEKAAEDLKLTVNIDQDSMRLVIRELIFNALKFSRPDSEVMILHEISRERSAGREQKNLILLFLNKPEPDQSGNTGIMPEYRNLIFEPFFRLSRLVYEQYPTLDYGLGLTLVDGIARRHGGSVHAFNIVSHLNTESPETLVNVELSLPLRMKKV